MRKDSLVIFSLAVVVSASVVGTGYYFSVVAPLKADANSRQAVTNQESQTQEISDSPVRPSPEYFPTRTNKPIECTLPDGSTFWTNASRCEDADLDNRISRADPVKIYRPKAVSSSSQAKVKKVSTSNGDKPNLRLIGKSPPPNLPPECRFPVGRALEIERSLSAADDPKESIWRESYCEFRCEARTDNCPVPDSYYGYRFNELCQEYHWRTCN